ncbi:MULTISPECIES: hypothetical protein [Enterococcus]|uniref:Uncharacterized protein n=1 Tax=Candidatus Enterococcus murrayae TaxID=2815321 RepID=A0ABS3HI16_9ENTE|nr:hypothetical protein [Enterococcus sp. MJM16]MBO0453099.1 hypothetical protein [Enterococcus sp. MJM16]
MFHVFLVLPLFIFAFFMLATMISAIVILVASAVGGASVALLVKNKDAKRLLFVGISIIAFIAGLFLVPFILIYSNLSGNLFLPLEICLLICIAVLSFLGIRFTNTIEVKAGKTILKGIFFVVLFLAVVGAISMPIIVSFFSV